MKNLKQPLVGPLLLQTQLKDPRDKKNALPRLHVSDGRSGDQVLLKYFEMSLLVGGWGGGAGPTREQLPARVKDQHKYFL